MIRLLKLFALSGVERRLLLEAAPVVLAVRLALWVLPSPLIVRWVRRTATRDRDSAAPRIVIGTIVWAVEAISRHVPRASCLTQALAARWLLRAHGYGSDLCLGVASAGTGAFMAHAWLERRGHILIGGTDSVRLTRMPTLPDARGVRMPAERS
jgi:hypothetical protein